MKTISIDVHHPLSRRLLLTGMLLPGLAFLVHLELIYALVSWICEDPDARRLIMPASTLLMALVAAAGGLTAYRQWRHGGSEWKNEEGSPLARSRFMAIWGMGMGAIFVLSIIAMGAAAFFYSPCQR
jgi:hypothetical protein